ncbi:hypothetical protein [Oerskovia enterophila]|uniref:hypothetical protein n=1 Tax=Oerskovia enterophila TaxID=43678 RepID=UPI003821DBCD
MVLTTMVDQLFGTAQHRDARDLSNFLVHMTRSPEDLASIITSGCLEARSRCGLGRKHGEVAGGHHAICLTEMPLAELDRLAKRGKSYGIAFPKDFVLKNGGQPIWYLDHDSAPHAAMEAIMEEVAQRKEWDNPIWALTPFVETVVRSGSTGAKYRDWRWEREWRVPRDMYFDLKDVATLVLLDGAEPVYLEGVELGVPLYRHPKHDYVWVEGPTPAVVAAVERMLELFHENYLSPDDAGLSYVTAEGGYIWVVEEHETEDALANLFGSMPTEIWEDLSGHLNQISGTWASRAEVEGIGTDV